MFFSFCFLHFDLVSLHFKISCVFLVYNCDNFPSFLCGMVNLLLLPIDWQYIGLYPIISEWPWRSGEGSNMIQPKYRHCVTLELIIREIEELYCWATIVWPWMNMIKIKLYTTKMYATCGFLQIGCVLETTRSNNKWDRGTFMLGSHHITFKEWPNVTSDTIERSACYGFL